MRRGWVVAMLCIVGSCGTPELFQCESDTECDEGLCERNGFCSFEDGSCDSGRRYGEHAGQLSGNCVAEPAGSTGVAAQTGGSTSGADGEDPSTTSGDDGRGTTAAVADSGPTTDSGSTSESSASSASSESSSDGTDEGGSSSTGAMTAPHPYEGCMDADDCSIQDATCAPVLRGSPQCLPPCTIEDDCPVPPEPATQLTCIMNFCVLVCGGMGGLCPTDMVCDPLGFCTVPE